MTEKSAGVGCIIRDAAEDDLAAVTAIESACFAFPWTYRGFHAELGASDCLFLVAQDPTGVVGYLCGRTVEPRTACIDNLAVHPARRRSGIATRLLHAAFERWSASGVARVTLEVRTHNIPAIALYRAHGFATIGARRSFYPDGADALVMAVERTPDRTTPL